MCLNPFLRDYVLAYFHSTCQVIFISSDFGGLFGILNLAEMNAGVNGKLREQTDWMRIMTF